jgi:hypothetical protein
MAESSMENAMEEPTETEPKTKKRVKLSQAQRRVMNEVKEKGFYTCIENYTPARKLIALGLLHETGRSSLGVITLEKVKEPQSS